MRMNKGQPFMDVEADFDDAPTFSEKVLYERLGKGDARFVLGVADEYDHVIKAIGPKAVRAILAVNPRLVQRLGLGETITEFLDDARDDQDRWREEQYPSQVILDGDAARDLWKICHDEYRRYYNPEESLDDDILRAYNVLTEALGPDAIAERQEERDRLPEKLKRQEEKVKGQRAERELRNKRYEAHDAIVAATNDKARREAIALYKAAYPAGRS